MTLALPLTGAATKSAPSALSLLRIAADSSTAMVELSTTTGGILPLPAATPGTNLAFAEDTFLPARPVGNDRKQPIDCFQIRRAIDDFTADLRKRFRFGAGAIPDRYIMAGFDEPLGHRESHAADADPADLLRVVRRHCQLLCVSTLS